MTRASLWDELLPLPLPPHTAWSAAQRFMSVFTLSLFLFAVFWAGFTARHNPEARALNVAALEQAVLGGAKHPDFSQYVDLGVLSRHDLRSKGGRVIFVGDIHGMHSSLRHLLKKVKFDAAHDTLVHVGDIIVKGPHSRKVLQELMDLNAVGVRGNQDQKVVEWRGWIEWVLREKGGEEWLEQMEKDLNAKKEPSKVDYERSRRLAAAKGWNIPEGWKFGSKVYRLAKCVATFDFVYAADPTTRQLKPKEYQYLLDLPVALHIPPLHTIVVHAGILPMDTRRKILSRRQPLSHSPKAKHNKTEPALRNIQELALLSDVPQNTDPWSKMNMRSIRNNGKLSRDNHGAPWAKLWNRVIGLCDGFDAEPESVGLEDTTFDDASGWSEWIDKQFKGVKSLPCREITVVYGHAAARGLDIKKWSKGLDTGCVYNLRLTALVLGKRWKTANTSSDIDYLSETDDDVEGELVSYGSKGKGKIVQVRCAGGSG